jgi:hypothetical protein
MKRKSKNNETKTKLYIGIDNGVSGSIGLINLENTFSIFCKTPVKKTLNYTKTVKNLNRINCDLLEKFLEKYTQGYDNCIAILERPMVNPGRFVATASALRAFEATLICLERFNIPVQFVDSKEWQKELLPKGKGKDYLKYASLEIGRRLFPHLLFKDDADGILIAEWARRKGL